MFFFRLFPLQKHVKGHQINKNEFFFELLIINPNLEFFNFACCITHFKHCPLIDITLVYFLYFSILWCNQTNWDLKSQTTESIWWRGIHWLDKMKFIIFDWFSMKKLILNLITFALLVKTLFTKWTKYLPKSTQGTPCSSWPPQWSYDIYINHNNSYN